MAAVLVESTEKLTLDIPQEASVTAVAFKVPGLDLFEVEMDLETAVRDMKKLAHEGCGIEPEHMRLIYKDVVLKDAETLASIGIEGAEPIRILFTAGHSAMAGGSKGPPRQSANPFNPPVHGYPGSKGDRPSRVSGRPGGMGLIRKYGIMMKRQEFREKAEDIGFRKYR